MSDKHLQTRKTISTSMAVVGLSSIASVVGIVIKIIAGGTLGAVGAGLLMAVGIFYYFKSLASFKDLEYGNANGQSWLAMIASITATLLAFFV